MSKKQPTGNVTKAKLPTSENKATATKAQLKKETEEAMAEEKSMIDEMKKPDLLTNIIKEIHKEGIVGNQDVIAVLILKIMLRQVCDAKPESSNIIVSDKSGSGKDAVTKAVCRVMLKESQYKHRSKLTRQIFTYWNTDKKSQKEGFTWQDKVIHIEDPDEELLKCDGFRTMASGGSEGTVVKDQRAVDYRVNGKPIMIVTSYSASIDIEGMRRWDSIQMDTSKKLTDAVVLANMLKRQRTSNVKYNNALRTGLRNIRTRCVYIPYVDKLVDVFSSNLVNRTLSYTFLDYICASAVLHQHQREIIKRNGAEYVVANWFDYDYARFVFGTCSNEEGVALNDSEREFMEILKSTTEAMMISDITKRFSRSRQWIYDNLDKLKSMGLIGETTIPNNQNVDVKALYSKDWNLTVNKLRFSDALNITLESQKEKQQKEIFGFKGCKGFWENVIDNINKIRYKEGLLPLCLSFSIKPLKPLNSPVVGCKNDTLQPLTTSRRYKEKQKQLI